MINRRGYSRGQTTGRFFTDQVSVKIFFQRLRDVYISFPLGIKLLRKTKNLTRKQFFKQPLDLSAQPSWPLVLSMSQLCRTWTRKLLS